jgi:hypothetical protein
MRLIEERAYNPIPFPNGSFRLIACAEPQMLANSRDAWPATEAQPGYFVPPNR